jgi:hypothetical protein
MLFAGQYQAEVASAVDTHEEQARIRTSRIRVTPPTKTDHEPARDRGTPPNVHRIAKSGNCFFNSTRPVAPPSHAMNTTTEAQRVRQGEAVETDAPEQWGYVPAGQQRQMYNTKNFSDYLPLAFATGGVVAVLGTAG